MTNGYALREAGDVPWTGTGGQSDVHSHSWIICNAIFDRIRNMSMFQGWTIRRINRALQIETGTQIPFLGFYQADELLSPDGEYSTSTIGFDCRTNVGFQIVVADNDPVECLQTLDACSWYLLNQLLRDDTLTNLIKPDIPDSKIEGFPRGRISERWGLTGQRNETPVGERLVELTFAHRIYFNPTEFPDLNRVAVRAIPAGKDPNAVQPVTIVYDFNPESVPYPLPPGTPSPFPFPPSPAQQQERTNADGQKPAGAGPFGPSARSATADRGPSAGSGGALAGSADDSESEPPSGGI